MTVITNKYLLLRFTLKRNNLEGNYHLENVQLSEVKEYKYLGMTFTNFPSRQNHINGVTLRAKQIIGLESQMIMEEETATNKNNANIEAFQRRAARFVLQKNQDLRLDTLEKRGHAANLTLLHKIQQCTIEINPDQFITPMTQSNIWKYHTIPSK